MTVDEMQRYLTVRHTQGLYRQERLSVRLPGARVRLELEGNPIDCLDFSANDYLGLFDAPAPREALAASVLVDGVGSTGSPLLSGFSQAHAELVAVLCDWLGTEDALLFSSGFAANQAMLGALVGPDDTLLLDKLCHASMQDTLFQKASGSFRRYPHQDLKRLGQLVGRTTNAVVATEGVFSMDGDITDCATLLSQLGQTPLLLDDAHGLGVLGEQGRGSWAYHGLPANALQCLMGNFGKALGGSGGFLTGSKVVIDFIRQQARHYIYSTALPPAMCRAMTVSIGLCRTEQWRRDKLWQNIQLFRQLANAAGLPLLPSTTAIQPVLCRDNQQVLLLAHALKQQGLCVAPVRPPTVPQARLRLSLSAAHDDADIRQLVIGLTQVFEEFAC